MRVLDQNTTDAPRKKKDNALHLTHVMDCVLDLLSTFSDTPSESAKKFDAAVKTQKTWRAMRARGECDLGGFVPFFSVSSSLAPAGCPGGGRRSVGQAA